MKNVWKRLFKNLNDKILPKTLSNVWQIKIDRYIPPEKGFFWTLILIIRNVRQSAPNFKGKANCYIRNAQIILYWTRKRSAAYINEQAVRF